MNIDLGTEVVRNTLMGHMVIHGMTEAVNKNMVNEAIDASAAGGTFVEVVLTVNGEEINLQSFVDEWESQVDRMIAAEAKGQISTKFSDIQQLLYDLEERIKEEEEEEE